MWNKIDKNIKKCFTFLKQLNLIKK
jgi:hypothetical protein